MKTVELKYFENKEFVLTGVDGEMLIDSNENFEKREYVDYRDAQILRFCLDGIVYCSIEDPYDGYRSSMDSIIISNIPIKNKIPYHKVYAKYRDKSEWGNQESDLIDFYDKITNSVVITIGTDNWDDYYPTFVCDWNPKELAINKDKKTYNIYMRNNKLKRILK